MKLTLFAMLLLITNITMAGYEAGNGENCFGQAQGDVAIAKKAIEECNAGVDTRAFDELMTGFEDNSYSRSNRKIIRAMYKLYQIYYSAEEIKNPCLLREFAKFDLLKARVMDGIIGCYP